MTRNCELQLPRGAGVGLLASWQARRSSSLDGSVHVAPRRDGCQKKKPRRCIERTAGPPWLGSSAHHEPVRKSSFLIIEAAESRFNELPGRIPFHALGAALQARGFAADSRRHFPPRHSRGKPFVIEIAGDLLASPWRLLPGPLRAVA